MSAFTMNLIKRVSQVVTVLMVIGSTFQVHAEEQKKLYKWVDEKGNVHFSDEPRPGAKEITVKDVPTVKMEQPKFNNQVLRQFGENLEGPAQNEPAYSQVALSFPANNGVIRNNAATIHLEAQVEPELFDGHQIRFFLDGRPVGNDNNATKVTIEQASYGEHTAFVVILNSQGKQIQQSATHNFVLLNNINPNLRANRNSNK